MPVSVNDPVYAICHRSRGSVLSITCSDPLIDPDSKAKILLHDTSSSRELFLFLNTLRKIRTQKNHVYQEYSSDYVSSSLEEQSLHQLVVGKKLGPKVGSLYIRHWYRITFDHVMRNYHSKRTSSDIYSAFINGHLILTSLEKCRFKNNDHPLLNRLHQKPEPTSIVFPDLCEGRLAA
ncbi:MAG: hypothetical protein HQL45_03090 [Alphaproteobacteria bacterium]|nr:hypothetical protein [Alphaproteobacteria bacterium]